MLKLAIIGRPNVGKSTLFNRLVGKSVAIVDATPGVTRDRKEGNARLGPLSFVVVDTAGLEQAETGTLQAQMMDQTVIAMEEAELLMLVIDGRAGLHPLDEHFALAVRKTGKPVVLVVNKCEGKLRAGIQEAYQLGLGDPVPVSAEHGDGMADLHDALVAAAEKAGLDLEGEAQTPSGDTLQLAIAGRPNVGKSTLFNRLLKEERSIASPVAGTTRDAIYADWEYDGKPVRLVDTAGLRRRAKREGKLELKSVEDSYRAIQYANVVILVVEGTDPLNKVDLQLASHILEEGRGLVIAVNKWDVVEDKEKTRGDLKAQLQYSLAQGAGLPVVMISALNGTKIHDAMQACFAVLERWNKRISTAKLNKWLNEATQRHEPPLSKGRRIKIRYMTQVKARPPTFVLFSSSHIADLPESYLRYLIGGLRETFDLDGVPIRMLMRKEENPFDKD